MKGIKFALLSALVGASIIITAVYFCTSGSNIQPRSADPVGSLSENMARAVAQPPQMVDKKAVAEQYAKLPMHFEPNVGQTDEQVKYLARGHGYSLFLTNNEAVLSLRKTSDRKSSVASVVRMKVDGGIASSPAGSEATEGRSNYLLGNDQARWHTDVANYNKVRYENVLPGIDAVYYGNGQELEYDFIVAPGSDPSVIKLAFEGLENAKVEKGSGDLVLETGAGAIRQLKPVVYQIADNERREIAAEYHLEKRDDAFVASFRLADYDRSRELVIDPILTYGSYLGGNAFDEGRGIAADADGNAYVVGTAASVDFPTTAGTIKPVLLPSNNNQTWYDAFVTKVNPTGTALVFSTYYGGRNGSETGTGVALDPAGNIILSGTTMANDLPVVNPYQSTFGGTDDAFAAKLNPTGSAIIYSTYIGGNSTDTGGRIAVNATTGDTVFTGYASSGNFPTTPGAFKERLCDGTPGSCNGIFYSGSYLVKLTATGSIVYSTLFDASVQDLTIDAADNATFAGGIGGNALPTTPGAYQPANSGGGDGFIAKMNPAGNALTFATYLGGGLQSDVVKGIVLDANENIYVTGQTENLGFPTTAGVFDQTFNGNHDIFVTKLNAAGSQLVYSTFLGGQQKDQPFAIGLGANNDVFVTGETLSGANFPLKNSLNGTAGTIFLTRLNSDASALVFSTLLGVGGAYDLAVDNASNAYITGHTTSVLVTPNAFQTVRNGNPSNTSSKDAFVLKLAPTEEDVPAYTISGMIANENAGFTNNYEPIVVTLTGSQSRSMTVPYSGGQYSFGSVPGGGTYTITVTQTGYVVSPESVTFNNLGANQSADFTILRNHAPMGVITSPEHGATYNAPASITIQATASDEDGDDIVKVDFVAYSSSAGSVPLGTDTTAPYEFTWTDVPVDTWALYAYPTDSKGLRGDSTPTVHVFVVDPSPVSVSITSPTANQSFVEGGYVPISVSVPPSVNLVQVRDQNNNLVAWLTGSPWSSTWRVMEIGTYTLTATASNSQGQTAVSEPVTINVGPINHLITGKVIDNFTSAPLPDTVIHLTSPSNPSINATATTDANGDYSFTNLGTTPDDSVTLTPVREGYTFEPPTRSIGYMGYLDEWPHQTFQASRATTMEVELTSPTAGQTFAAPATIDLAANATTSDGTITQVQFYRGQNNQAVVIATDTEAPYEYHWTEVPAGSYELYARATDSNGAVKDSQIVRVTVTAPPTTVRLQGDITSPGGGFMPGITVQLSGTNAAGAPVNQTSVSNGFGAYGFFNVPAGGDYTITPQGTSITFTPPSATFTDVFADNLDVDFEASATNQSPNVQLTSPADGAVFTMPAAIQVNATATDPDGSILRIRVTAVSATQSTTIGETLGGTFSVLWQPNLPGPYTIWASALDNGGLQTSASIQITVNPPAAVSISGRTVDRNSEGIEGATVELREQGGEENVVSTATTDAAGNYTIAGIETFRNYTLRASKLDYSFSPQVRNYFNLSQTQTGVDFTGTLQVVNSDFNGDGETDVSVFRPTTGMWYVNGSGGDGYSALQFGNGSLGDVVTPGNYDGDKKIDYAVFRQGAWYIRKSSNSTVRSVEFGLAGDKPVPADYDGDGRTDVAVWRPSNGVWYIELSSNGQYDYRYYGTDGDMPIAADYDGDGMADTAVFRPSTGTWYIHYSSTGADVITVWGMRGDMAVAGDFDGDKRTDITVFRPSDGNWYVLRSSDNQLIAAHWGAVGDKPVPGDYDHDGKTDFAVYRESDLMWYMLMSRGGRQTSKQFGIAGDIPIPAAYVQ